MVALGIDAEIFSRWDSSDLAQFEAFEQRLDEARAAGDETVCLPKSETPLSITAAEKLFDAWSKKIAPVETGQVEQREK